MLSKEQIAVKSHKPFVIPLSVYKNTVHIQKGPNDRGCNIIPQYCRAAQVKGFTKEEYWVWQICKPCCRSFFLFVCFLGSELVEHNVCDIDNSEDKSVIHQPPVILF